MVYTVGRDVSFRDGVVVVIQQQSVKTLLYSLSPKHCCRRH